MATKIIVSNSTPLINFATINEIQILRKLFKKIIIPQAVWQEVVIERAARISTPNRKGRLDR